MVITRWLRAVDSAIRSLVTTTIEARPSTWRSEARTSANIAWARACRAPAANSSPRRCLAASKVLTGRMAIVRTGRARLYRGPPASARQRRRKLQRSRAQATPRLRVVHQRVGHERRQAVGRLVGDHAVERSDVGGGDARGALLDAGLLAERLGRALDGATPDEGADGHHRRRRARQRLAHPGERQ